MRTVVLFSPAERMGRTTMAMMLAAALVAGRRMWEVTLLDAAAGGGPGPLVNWARKQRRRSQEIADRLVARPVRGVGELLAELDLAAAGTRLPDRTPSRLVLIDAGAEVDDRAHVALRAAHLVLVPFRSLEGAERAGPAIKAALPAHVAAWSVACGFEASGPGADLRAEMRRAGKAIPGLRMIYADLPCDPNFAEAMRDGPPPEGPYEPAWAMAAAAAERVVEPLLYDAIQSLGRSGIDRPTHRLMLPPEDAPIWPPPGTRT